MSKIPRKSPGNPPGKFRKIRKFSPRQKRHFTAVFWSFSADFRGENFRKISENFGKFPKFPKNPEIFGTRQPSKTHFFTPVYSREISRKNFDTNTQPCFWATLKNENFEIFMLFCSREISRGQNRKMPKKGSFTLKK